MSANDTASNQLVGASDHSVSQPAGPTTGQVALAMPRSVDDLSPEWLTTVLGHEVTSMEVRDVIWGTATKVLARVSYPDSVDNAAPTAICVKGGFEDNLRAMGLHTAYEIEVNFYRDIVPELDVPLPGCYYASFNADEQQGILVLDDLTAHGYSFGDPLTPWSPDRVASALEVQAAWHRQTWGETNGPLGGLTRGSSSVRQAAHFLLGEAHWDAHFAQDGAPTLPEELQDRMRIAAAYRALWERDERGTAALAHGDAHIGNTYLDADSRPAFLDWQGVCRAPVFYDVAYFVCGALTPEDRRAEERNLIEHYCDALAAGDGPVIDRDDAWLDYRRYAMHGFLWAVTPPVMQSMERVRAMGERHVTAINDLESFAALGV